LFLALNILLFYFVAASRAGFFEVVLRILEFGGKAI
jgi:hypothetical protein